MTPPTGLRVLVVEDEGGIALLLEDMLDSLGFEVVASVARLSDAFKAADTEEFDVAILDVNLRGEQSFPLARALRDRGTPFIFSTGYGAIAIPQDLQDRTVLTKPFAMQQLQRAVAALMSR